MMANANIAASLISVFFGVVAATVLLLAVPLFQHYEHELSAKSRRWTLRAFTAAYILLFIVLQATAPRMISFATIATIDNTAPLARVWIGAHNEVASVFPFPIDFMHK